MHDPSTADRHESMKPAPASPPDVDAKLAERSQLIIRCVRVATPRTRRKYAWYRVKVSRVLRNRSDSVPEEFLDVAALGVKPGIPEGESILYLVPYNPVTGAPPWKLLGGGADEGVRRPPHAAEDGKKLNASRPR
jgi:hypothetical protein